LACGGSAGEAVAYYIILERACHTQLLADAAAANGVAKKYVSEEVAKYTKNLQKSSGIMYMQFIPEYEMVLKESKGDFLE
jgi:ribulose-5-phosphate 4-epimerase/fuculose-1-phosphate aldolase